MIKDESLEWEEISTEHIIQDEWIDFRKSAYRYPDGRVFEPYYSYSRRDYAVIVASDIDGNYLCVRQFRQGIREVTTEFPAGGIERKDGIEYGDRKEAEDALLAAKRELKEETGYESDEWSHLLTVPASATISDSAKTVHRELISSCFVRSLASSSRESIGIFSRLAMTSTNFPVPAAHFSFI